jgi:hypothetical protein
VPWKTVDIYPLGTAFAGLPVLAVKKIFGCEEDKVPILPSCIPCPESGRRAAAWNLLSGLAHAAWGEVS